MMWQDGECQECGDPIKFVLVPDTCKACKMLSAMRRIAYALEVKVGIE